MTAQQIVENYLGTYHHIEQEVQYHYFCCKCNHHKPRLSINYDNNMFKCWKCGFSGKSLVKLLYTVNAPKAQIDDLKKYYGIKSKFVDSSERNFDNLPEQIAFNLFGNPVQIKDKKKAGDDWFPVSRLAGARKLRRRPYAYLRNRGLTDFEINYYNIQYCPSMNKLVFPSYDVQGDLNYFIYRDYTKDGKYFIPKGFSKDVIFYESLIDFSQPITLVEGVFDAYKTGFNSIPLLGSFMPKIILSRVLAYETPEVVIFLDPDAYQSALKISKIFIQYNIPVRIKGHGDKDAGDMEKEIIHRDLQNLEIIDKLNYINYI